MNTHNHLDHRRHVAALLFAVLASLGLLSPLPLAAQETVLEPGDLIRVRPIQKPPRGPRRIKGNLVSIDADTLRFDRRGETLQYSLTDINKLEVSTGEKERVAGTLIGILSGGVLGLGLGSAINGIGGGVNGFKVGALAGGVAGYSLLAAEKWTKVPTEGLSVTLGPGTLVLRLSP